MTRVACQQLAPDDGRVYNSAAVFDATGLRAVYRKLHLWDREKLVFTPGSAPPPVLDTRVGRLAVVICYDLECKTFTYQRIDSDDGVRAIAPHVAEISRADLMPAHEATATKRLQRLQGR